jgi:ATP-binding cassette, subfamily C, bacterial
VKTLRYFVAAYPARCAAVLAWLIIAGAMEGLGLSTLLPLLSVATGSGISRTGYEGRVSAALASLGIPADPGVLISIVIAALWIKAVLMLLSKRQVGYAVARIATDLRLRLLRGLLAARWSYASRQPAGRAANAMATEADRASYAFEYLALIASYSVETVVYVGIACAVSWRGTLVAGAASGLMLGLLNALVRMAHRAGRKQTALLDSLLTRTTDALGAVKLLKATGREDAVGPLLSGDTERLNRQLERRVLAREALRALQEPVVGTLLALGLFAALRLFTIPLSSTLVLGLVFVRALTRVASIQGKYQAMVSETSALWAIDARIREAEAAREPSGGARRVALERGISVESVSLERDGRKLFEDLSLEIPSGRITAVIGASGIGKTTLTDLITGLVWPTGGRVSIDGVPLDELNLGAWRRQVGYVPQDLPMLHDSVRRNVTLGDPSLDDAAVETALRLAGAWEFVAGLPGGLDASVGERGALVSGGQRQRISIARALVHEPRLLIFDEATAALDAESEAAVWETIVSLRGRTTVVAISHHPHLASVADCVYRIADGRAERVDLASGGRAREAVVH